MEEKVKQNMLRCGEYLMYSIWIQGQLSDLVIFNRNKQLINDFVTVKEKIPEILVNERVIFWKKDFKDVKKDFEKEFADKLTDQDMADLNTIFYIRNAIAHSHVSLARNFLFYIPGSSKIEQNFQSSLEILNKHELNISASTIFKIDFFKDEIYFHNFDTIKRIDENLLERICNELSIPHSRIQ